MTGQLQAYPWSEIPLLEAGVAALMQKDWPEKRLGETPDNERT